MRKWCQFSLAHTIKLFLIKKKKNVSQREIKSGSELWKESNQHKWSKYQGRHYQIRWPEGWRGGGEGVQNVFTKQEILDQNQENEL